MLVFLAVSCDDVEEGNTSILQVTVPKVMADGSPYEIKIKSGVDRKFYPITATTTKGFFASKTKTISFSPNSEGDYTLLLVTDLRPGPATVNFTFTNNTDFVHQETIDFVKVSADSILSLKWTPATPTIVADNKSEINLELQSLAVKDSSFFPIHLKIIDPKLAIFKTGQATMDVFLDGAKTKTITIKSLFETGSTTLEASMGTSGFTRTALIALTAVDPTKLYQINFDTTAASLSADGISKTRISIEPLLGTNLNGTSMTIQSSAGSVSPSKITFDATTTAYNVDITSPLSPEKANILFFLVSGANANLARSTRKLEFRKALPESIQILSPPAEITAGIEPYLIQTQLFRSTGTPSTNTEVFYVAVDSLGRYAGDFFSAIKSNNEGKCKVSFIRKSGSVYKGKVFITAKALKGAQDTVRHRVLTILK
ncbi:MAG TPA: hypothetical protein VK508_15285 [Cyclobacteriaceae bacterium]|nr:hypothetical protein [Cyclobacteriaceae bacterium]